MAEKSIKPSTISNLFSEIAAFTGIRESGSGVMRTG